MKRPIAKLVPPYVERRSIIAEVLVGLSSKVSAAMVKGAKANNKP